MKITVINGTEKRGVTYKLKEKFLERFKMNSQITNTICPKNALIFVAVAQVAVCTENKPVKIICT